MDPLKEADEALRRTKGGVTLARDVVIGLIEAARKQDVWHAGKSPREPEFLGRTTTDDVPPVPEDIQGELLEVELPRQIEVEWETESTAGTTRARLELSNPRDAEVDRLIQVLRD